MIAKPRFSRRVPVPARRAAGVQEPFIPIVASWIRGTPGTISLGQGVVSWGPPPEAFAAMADFSADPENHKYLPDAGLPALRKAFEEKLAAENGIRAPYARRLIVTAGSNQAFLNAVLCVCDPGDEVILPLPWYFNHEMAIALAGARAVGVPTDALYRPRPEAIEAAMTRRTRAVVTVSPNNPTGAVYPRETLLAINSLCAGRGIFHISDEAYEYFTHDGAGHVSPGAFGNDDVTISLFSLSKAYGMASWRVGFLLAPERLHDELIKIQDTVIVCAPAVSQFAGLGALRAGRAYAAARLPAVAAARETVHARLSEIPDLLEVPKTPGAFYFFARVRARMRAAVLAERLVREHRVAVIPGETFGPVGGCRLRISYGSLDEAAAAEGADRLVRGLKRILGGTGGRS